MIPSVLQYGDTPLHTSARYGHAGVIRILVSARCNASEQNKVGAESELISRLVFKPFLSGRELS